MSEMADKLRVMPDFRSTTRATTAQIEQAEAALGLRFADEYRAYLAACGVATAGGHEFTGICALPRLNVVRVTVDEKHINPTALADWYVVEHLNIDDIVIWQAGTGEVYQTAPGREPMRLCGSLGEYLAR